MVRFDRHSLILTSNDTGETAAELIGIFEEHLGEPKGG